MAAKREKVIITCAVTGSVHTPSVSSDWTGDNYAHARLSQSSCSRSGSEQDARARERKTTFQMTANLEKHGWIGGLEATRRSMRHVR